VIHMLNGELVDSSPDRPCQIAVKNGDQIYATANQWIKLKTSKNAHIVEFNEILDPCDPAKDEDAVRIWTVSQISFDREKRLSGAVLVSPGFMFRIIVRIPENFWNLDRFFTSFFIPS